MYFCLWCSFIWLLLYLHSNLEFEKLKQVLRIQPKPLNRLGWREVFRRYIYLGSILKTIFGGSEVAETDIFDTSSSSIFVNPSYNSVRMN